MHEAGKPTTATVVAYDITQRKQIEAQLRKSLEEKVVLLQEIHHRVKNNMQVISSLLSLQTGYVDNPLVIEYFRDSQSRVHSMALVHEKLYRSQDLTRIDFAEYIEDLAHHLFQMHHINSQDISLNVETDSAFVKLDQAIPCGLILNELISNALKHAFPPGQNGEVWVVLKAEHPEMLNLTIGDNGIGFPGHIDFYNSGTLGLQLVNTLIKQLGGTIELGSRFSTEFRIRFTVFP
jgi:two-component sensor histidine kinase